LGVTFGIAVFILQAGLITGFQSTFVNIIIENSAHVHLYNEPKVSSISLLDRHNTDQSAWNVLHHAKPPNIEPKLTNPWGLLQQIEQDPQVRSASPFVGAQVFFRYGTAELPGQAIGVLIEKENRMFDLENKLIEGRLDDMRTRKDGIIVGSGVARQLNLHVGDRIRLTSSFGLTRDYKVVAIHRSGIKDLDKSRAYIHLSEAQALLAQSSGYITDINLKIKDIDEAEQTATRMRRQFGYDVIDWKTANKHIFSVFKIQNLVTIVVITSILIVSGFGIFNILTMMIYEKMTDIAILKSMGYTDREVLNIFLTQALIIGLVGGLIGLFVGFVSSYAVSKLPIRIEGEVLFDGLTVNFSPVFYVSAYGFGLLITVIAGYLPARKAASLDPVDTLRNRA
jgi:lipoprotein-releasing system permease protein